MNTDSEFAAQMAAVIAATEVEKLNQETPIPFTIVPQGYKLDTLERLLAEPARKRGTLNATTPEAFVALVKRFGEEPAESNDTVVTYNRDAATFVAVLNVNSWGDYRIGFTLKHSAPWQAWDKLLDESVSQIALAEFLEEHCHEIIEPVGASVLQIVKNLEVSQTGRLVSAVNLHNGSVEVSWVQNTDAQTQPAKANFKMPSELLIGIPMFEGFTPIAIKVKLRYRMDSDKLTFTLTVPNLDTIRREHIEEVKNSIQAKLTDILFVEGAIPTITAGL